MSADVDLDTVGSCILFYCRDKLLVIHVLLLFSGFMNLTSRPTSRLADGDFPTRRIPTRRMPICWG